MWETHHECRSCSSRKHGFSSAIFVSPHYMFCLTCILDGPWNMFFKTSLGFQVPSNNSLNISGFTIYTRWAGWHQGEKQWNPIETLALSEFGLVFQSIDIFTGKKKGFQPSKVGGVPFDFSAIPCSSPLAIVQYPTVNEQNHQKNMDNTPLGWSENRIS
jgi:hypothetical protein